MGRDLEENIKPSEADLPIKEGRSEHAEELRQLVARVMESDDESVRRSFLRVLRKTVGQLIKEFQPKGVIKIRPSVLKSLQLVRRDRFFYPKDLMGSISDVYGVIREMEELGLVRFTGIEGKVPHKYSITSKGRRVLDKIETEFRVKYNGRSLEGERSYTVRIS